MPAPSLPTAPATPTLHVLPPPAATPAKRGGLNLGKIGKTDSSKKTETYPTATLPDEEREMVSVLLTQKDQVKVLEGSIKAIEASLKERMMPQWFALAQGQVTPPSSILAQGPIAEGEFAPRDVAMLTVCGDTGGRYSGTTDDAAIAQIEALVGEELFAEHFDTETTLTMQLGKLAPELRQPLVDDLLEVLAKHGCDQAVTATQKCTLKELSRKARYQVFTLEQNLALHALLPMTVSFKRKAA